MLPYMHCKFVIEIFNIANFIYVKKKIARAGY